MMVKVGEVNCVLFNILVERLCNHNRATSIEPDLLYNQLSIVDVSHLLHIVRSLLNPCRSLSAVSSAL